MEQQPPTILLVEDDCDIRDVTHALLESLGYAVIEASHPAAALAIVAGAAPIDLIFTDVQMPGMNGFQLADAIRRIRPTIPVVYATGYAGTLAGNDNHPHGPILSKPYRMATLRSVVGQSLKRH
ncbi:MAG TPA: response regulator [Aliidongia sp.]|uniref:response regulator n=1 Tax=Aliidongia sp. TaxID=1914230 RepID=UPI002DDCF1F0|nr:response regulator [Aliidongia sp.]HEV2674698.1 response regulator [Aliidongia sp.]